MTRRFALLSAWVAGTALVTGVQAHEPRPPASTTASAPAPPAEAAAVVDAFHAALARGDTAGALMLMSEDVLVLEQGGAERSRAEYAAEHLAADAEFAAATRHVQTRRTGHGGADFALVATEGRNTGSFRDRTIDSDSAETMVLRRTPQGWRISHIHWSSRQRPTPRAP